MYSTTERVPKVLKVAVTLAFTAALATAPLAIAQEKAETKEVTGEIVDMMCYIDHNAMGDKHAGCGEKCIKGGAPVGIVSDGKAMIVVGAHKPMNDELAPLAGKTVTLKGKMVTNGGVSMLENAEIVKK
jgi:hypothetical protein